jgi:hypothetical protein
MLEEFWALLHVDVKNGGRLRTASRPVNLGPLVFRSQAFGLGTFCHFGSDGL